MTARPQRLAADLGDLAWPVQTARLRIRPATVDDAEATWGFRKLPEVSNWLTPAPDTFDDYLDTFRDPARLASTLIIEMPGVGVIGDLMLAVGDGWAQHEAVDRARRTSAELGWAIHPLPRWPRARHRGCDRAASPLLRGAGRPQGHRVVLRGQRPLLAPDGASRHAARGQPHPGVAPPIRHLARHVHLRIVGRRAVSVCVTVRQVACQRRQRTVVLRRIETPLKRGLDASGGASGQRVTIRCSFLSAQDKRRPSRTVDPTQSCHRVGDAGHAGLSGEHRVHFGAVRVDAIRITGGS